MFFPSQQLKVIVIAEHTQLGQERRAADDGVTGFVVPGGGIMLPTFGTDRYILESGSCSTDTLSQPTRSKPRGESSKAFNSIWRKYTTDPLFGITMTVRRIERAGGSVV